MIVYDPNSHDEPPQEVNDQLLAAYVVIACIVACAAIVIGAILWA